MILSGLLDESVYLFYLVTRDFTDPGLCVFVLFLPLLEFFDSMIHRNEKNSAEP